MAITLYLFVKIYSRAIPEHSFTISTLIPSLKKFGKGMPKIESENPDSNVNQGPLLCTYLPKLTHLQSQDTPSQYQL